MFDKLKECLKSIFWGNNAQRTATTQTPVEASPIATQSIADGHKTTSKEMATVAEAVLSSASNDQVETKPKRPRKPRTPKDPGEKVTRAPRKKKDQQQG